MVKLVDVIGIRIGVGGWFGRVWEDENRQRCGVRPGCDARWTVVDGKMGGWSGWAVMVGGEV